MTASAELLALARKMDADESFLMPPKTIIALIERHNAEVEEYERVKAFACKTIAEISPEQRADQGRVSYGIIGLIMTLRAEVERLTRTIQPMQAMADAVLNFHRVWNASCAGMATHGQADAAHSSMLEAMHEYVISQDPEAAMNARGEP